jgi:hypothetical protein
LCKNCAIDSGLKGAEVVVECAPLPGGEITVHGMGITTKKIIVDPIDVEVPSQDECRGVTHRVSLGSELAKTNSESLNLALVTDEFDVDTFDENLNNEQNVDENDELSSSESDKENMQAPFDTTRDVLVSTGGEGNESNMPHSVTVVCDVPTSSCIDWRLYYTDEELRVLKSKHINLDEYPNHKDISRIGSAVCDSAVVVDDGHPRVRDEVIKKGQLFELLDTIKFFFQDYVVQPHRPFYVVKSNKDVWCIIRCQILSYNWGV